MLITSVDDKLKPPNIDPLVIKNISFDDFFNSRQHGKFTVNIRIQIEKLISILSGTELLWLKNK